ncbi:hypothetical protein QVD17_39790 [Tagetes erecta]|uniref:Uncharacterized protein n=1 Tax=Tagetes erecta TaxID=13708 RepID=A0AAD8JP71_TARER|nr:hypothetical protein QVD17_39790 [Tagetes erecta]
MIHLLKRSASTLTEPPPYLKPSKIFLVIDTIVNDREALSFSSFFFVGSTKCPSSRVDPYGRRSFYGMVAFGGQAVVSYVGGEGLEQEMVMAGGYG